MYPSLLATALFGALMAVEPSRAAFPRSKARSFLRAVFRSRVRGWPFISR
jgi:hypothetical protein